MLKSLTAAGLIAGLAAPAFAQDAAELPPPEEKNCRVIATTPDNAQAQPYGVPDLSVLEGTQAEGWFTLEVPDGYDVQAILCQRSTLIPAVNDFEAPAAGYPLNIDTYDAEGAKTGVAKLTYAGDGFTHEVLLGELDAAEQGWVDHRMRQFDQRAAEVAGDSAE